MEQLKQLYEQLSPRNSQRPKLCPEPIDLGDGLLMRQGLPEDQVEISAFNGKIHFPAAGRETEDMMNPEYLHPTADFSCFTMVVDTTKNNKIVSSVFSLPQIWFYGTPNPLAETEEEALKNCVPMVVLRPEAVGTLEEYRGKELIQKHFDVHHEWAAKLNSPIQFVGGLPHYYTRFGYDMSPSRDGGVGGSKSSAESVISACKKKLEKDETLPRLSFRPASPQDSEFLTRILRINSARRHGIWTDIPHDLWPNLLDEKQRQPGSLNSHQVAVLETVEDKQPVGFVQIHGMSRWVNLFELDDTVEVVSWSDATAALLEWLQTNELEVGANKMKLLRAPMAVTPDEKAESKGETTEEEKKEDTSIPAKEEKKEDSKEEASIPSQAGDKPPAPTTDATSSAPEAPAVSETAKLPDSWTFKLSLGSSHPSYKSVLPTAFPTTHKPYYWFTRVAHLPSFLTQITPLLDHRLKTSLTFSRWTGIVAICHSFHSGKGASIVSIKRGKIESIREGTKDDTRMSLAGPEVGALFGAFHGTSWMRMVLGHRTCSELEAEGDYIGSQLGMNLLDVLFPRMQSDAIIGLN